MATLPQNPLQQAMKEGVFFEIDELKALQMVADAFEPELKGLQSAPTASEPGSCVTGGEMLSPSCRLFGQEYDEVNRTLVSILALRWIWNNDYATFTSSQSSAHKLRQETFDRLHGLFKSSLQEDVDMFSLLIATVINDLGKSPKLAQEMSKMIGLPTHTINHDVVVYEAAKVDRVSCLEMLDSKPKEELLLGLRLGSTLNFAQLAQAENVPGSLRGLLDMKGHRHAFNKKFVQLILDVAGAAGHIDARGARAMNEPVAQAYLTTYQVAVDIIEGRSTLRQGYDAILARRADMLHEKGFRVLSVTDAQQRALLRMLLMSRTADTNQAEIFSQVFEKLPEPTRIRLVHGLNVDGYQDGRAILPYYMPAVFAAALVNIAQEPQTVKITAIGSLMHLLARALHDTRPKPGEEGQVVECNLLFASATVRSEEFRRDPTILDELTVPKDF